MEMVCTVEYCLTYVDGLIDGYVSEREHIVAAAREDGIQQLVEEPLEQSQCHDRLED